MENLTWSTITFKYKFIPVRFEVLSNAPEFIENAFISYSARLGKSKPSLLDFCNYVESKGFICHPKNRKEVTI